MKRPLASCASRCSSQDRPKIRSGAKAGTLRGASTSHTRPRRCAASSGRSVLATSSSTAHSSRPKATPTTSTATSPATHAASRAATSSETSTRSIRRAAGRGMLRRGAPTAARLPRLRQAATSDVACLPRRTLPSLPATLRYHRRARVPAHFPGGLPQAPARRGAEGHRQGRPVRGAAYQEELRATCTNPPER